MVKKRVPPEKAPHGVLFKRTKKQWERSINDHIGMLIDNSSIKDVQEVLLNVALAYYGYAVTKDPRAALIGPIGLKLATSKSEIAALTGVAALAGLAVTGLPKVEGFEISEGFYGMLSKPVDPQGKDVKCRTGQILKYCPLDGKWYCRFPNQGACPALLG